MILIVKDSPDPFLPLDPLEAMMRGIFNRIPFMSGTVTNEGMLFIGQAKALNATTEQMEAYWPSVGVRFISDVAATEREWLINNITFNYYNHPAGETGLARDQPLVDLLTDVMFMSPDQKMVEVMSRHHDRVYNYHLTQQTNNSLLGNFVGLDKEYSPIHLDDLTFLFDEMLGVDMTAKSPEDAALRNHSNVTNCLVQNSTEKDHMSLT